MASIPVRSAMVERSIKAGLATEPAEPDLLRRVASVMNAAPQYEGCHSLSWNCSVDVRGYRVSAISSVQNHLEELGYVVWYECCPCRAQMRGAVSWTPTTTEPRMVIDWGSWDKEIREAVGLLVSGALQQCVGMPELVTRTIAATLREQGHAVRVGNGAVCIERPPAPVGIAAA
jgi:sorbitol-specific phosphotransferase system component IIA